MGILYGNFDLTLDDKNRLLIPSEVRRAIDPEKEGTALFLVEGTTNGTPWLYPSRYYEELAATEVAELTPGEARLTLDHWLFATASKLEFDKQGRVLIPEKTMRRLALEREVTLIGSKDHLEIWNRTAWQEYLAELPVRAAKARETKLKTPLKIEA